ncbi:hypothetical protein JD844_015482 [Phrynosoma platyrhinos]|uniref:Snake toxin/toxin-like domain-containing protein n=1 Tax=Phrynosoma platyrhinos TaxID=52577 RepID=A0ABQ7SJ78_PHRPL|nr:hypothetical protein JD844_015482 [Phrynosoma platyrhinos]
MWDTHKPVWLSYRCDQVLLSTSPKDALPFQSKLEGDHEEHIGASFPAGSSSVPGDRQLVCEQQTRCKWKVVSSFAAHSLRCFTCERKRSNWNCLQLADCPSGSQKCLTIGSLSGTGRQLHDMST